MRKLIYLYNNLHLNKITLLFMLISSILMFITVNNFIDFDVLNIDHLRRYETIKKLFILDLYNILELIISLFVVILSFMELYNNSHLFDVVLIAHHKKPKVLTTKIISYLMIIITYITLVFIIISIIAVNKFQDNTLIYPIFKMFGYMIVVQVMVILLSLLLMNLFKNYFSNFILLIILIIKRIFLETNNKFFQEIIPYFDIDNLQINMSYIKIIIYLLILIIANYLIYKYKDIKT